MAPEGAVAEPPGQASAKEEPAGLQEEDEEEEEEEGDMGLGPVAGESARGPGEAKLEQQQQQSRIIVPRQDEIRVSLMPEGSRRPGDYDAVFAHCRSALDEWRRVMNGLCVFKIGIAVDPFARYHDSEFGYYKEGCWHFMEVTHRDTASRCKRLEEDLISYGRDFPGCRNIKPGGEGISASCTAPCHVYMVYSPCGAGRALDVEVQQRRRGLIFFIL